MFSTPNKANVQALNSNPREVSDDDTELEFFLFDGMSPLPFEETGVPVNFSPVTSLNFNHFPGISPPNIRQLGDVNACFSLETTRNENYQASLFHDGLFIGDETSANCIHSHANFQSNCLPSTPTDCPQYSPFRFDHAPSFLKKLELSTTKPTTQTTSVSTKMRVNVETDSRESNCIPENQRPSQHKLNVSTTCSWMKNYNSLKEYVDLNGHCNIMQKEVWWNEESECLRLGNWVNKVCAISLHYLHPIFHCCNILFVFVSSEAHLFSQIKISIATRRIQEASERGLINNFKRKNRSPRENWISVGHSKRPRELGREICKQCLLSK